MQPDERDAGYLWDMLDAARAVVQFTEGIRYEEYLKDRMRQFAAERAIGIIGEAAGRVSKALQDAHPEIPWRKIVAQRNILVHDYGDLRQDRIWRVVIERTDY